MIQTKQNWKKAVMLLCIIGGISILSLDLAEFKIIKYIMIELLFMAGLLLFVDANSVKRNLYGKWTAFVSVGCNLVLPILYFAFFFFVLYGNHQIDSALVSLVLIQATRVLAVLFGVGVFATSVITVLKDSSYLYACIGFQNLLLFLLTNKILAGIFISKSQSVSIFLILLTVYIIGLALLLFARSWMERRNHA